LRATKHFHQLGDFLALLAGVTAGDGVLDAVAHVITKDFFLNAPQGRANSGDLGYHINAIAVALNHAGETAHLAFDAAEAFETGRLNVGSHA
jgi:hypothetical protein